MTDEARIHDASLNYFNKWAGSYDRSLSQLWFRRNYALMERVLDPAPDARILDVGCGTGIMAERLARRVPHGRVVGVDAAEAMIDVARRKTDGPEVPPHPPRSRGTPSPPHAGAGDDSRARPDNLRFEVGVAHALPVADNAFDIALSTISFHHWTRPAAGVAEIFRALAPGGALYILDFCRANPIMALNDRLGKMFQRSHYGMASPADMRGWFTGAGFADVDVTRPRMFLMLATGRKP